MIDKNTRIAVIVLVILMFSVVTYTIINELSVTKFKEETVTPFNCQNRASIDYAVYLKPNSLYSQTILDKDKFIITEYIDHIHAKCTYQYFSDKPAKMTGQYEITAHLEGYTGQKENEVVVWVKTYTLKPLKTFSVEREHQFSIEEKIDIEHISYSDFAKKVIEESKVAANARLTVYMNVRVKVESESGIIEESLAPNIVIPLNTAYFKLGGAPLAEKDGVIQQTVKVPIPINKTKTGMMIIFDVLLLAALLYLLILTSGKETSPHEKLLNQIFKKHGDRMVALISNVSDIYEASYEVKSINDLVRISDDADKPILYEYQDGNNEINKFYVICDKEMYFLNINKIGRLNKREYSEATKELIKSLDKKNERAATVQK